MELPIIGSCLQLLSVSEDLAEVMEGTGDADNKMEITIPTKHFIPREYQEELLECAKKENTIACLGTGTGKTYIAIMLIKDMSENVRVPFQNGGKRTIFLVPTVPLVTQQASVLRDHTDLTIGEYYGARGVDYWSKQQWQTEFENYEVLVMTAEIFRVILQHGFLKLSQVNLIVFDECHRAIGNHPYMEIMRCFDTTPSQDRPKVLGLTASILNGKCKPHKVEEILQKLEKTLMGVARVTKNLLAYNKFGTKPRECVEFYPDPDIENSVPKLRTAIQLINIAASKFVDKTTSVLKKLKSFISDANEALLTLGPWCALEVCSQFAEEARNFLNNDLENLEKQKCEIAVEVLDTLRAFLLRILPDDESAVIYGISPKLKRLLLILHTWNFNDNLCSIIFVQKRFVARVLYLWLDKVSAVLPDYGFIKCNFIVGHGATSIDELRGLEMSTKKQTRIISDFREKLYNIVVSTSVIEEGLDVPQCNLVIRYDVPMDYRAYIQSKGRARAKKSFYVMMISESDRAMAMGDLTDYNIIEEVLYKRCIDRQQPSAEAILDHFDEEEILPPYMPVKRDGCPRITMSSAIALINRYCTLLPNSSVSYLRPSYKIKTIETQCGALYECTLYLPMNSPVKEAIIGKEMPTKRQAQMAAALKACEKLHKCGEFDEHLLPFSETIVTLSDDDNDEDEESTMLVAKGKKGTKKRVKYYPKEIPDVFRGDSPSSKTFDMYVYKLNVTLIDKLPHVRRNEFTDPQATERGYGLLTTKLIPAIQSFPLFISNGQAKLELQLVSSVESITEEQTLLLKLFHQKLFEDVLEVTQNQFFKPEEAKNSFYVVPVQVFDIGWSIDWEFLKSLKVKYERYQLPRVIADKISGEDYKDAVLIDSYRGENSGFYYTREVCYNLTPRSIMPDSKLSYMDHFFMKYNLSIKSENQPLLLVHHMRKPLVIFPPYLTTNLKKKAISQKKRRYIHLVPELVQVHPFPATMWFKALSLPCILHRLNYLLLAEDLRWQSLSDFGIGKAECKEFHWPLIRLSEVEETMTPIGEMTPMEEHAFGELVDGLAFSCDRYHQKFQKKENVNLKDYSGPELDLILSAFTPKNAVDIIDLERLETLGDSFLKYATSEYMYATYTNFNEGKLDAYKTKQISNRNLVKLAKARKLPDRIVAFKFEPKTNFLVPGFVVPEILEKSFLRSNIPERFWNIYKLDKDLSFTVEEVEEFVGRSRDHYNKFLSKRNDEIKAENGHEEAMLLEDHDSQVGWKLFRPLTRHHISDKTVADSVEALIGAYLDTGGRESALFFMSWLGLKVMKDTIDDKETGNSASKGLSINQRYKPFEFYQSPILSDDPHLLEKLEKLTRGFETVEKTVKYRFVDKAYLLQAFTHPSYTENRITDCYERLEFLGDSILDYLITSHLYYDSEHNYTPGQITDIRSSLVNNALLARLSVKNGFQRHLKYRSAELMSLVKRFIEKNFVWNHMDCNLDLEEDECEMDEEIEVPKILADIFEAVIGAVYLDSKRNLDVVWNVIINLMGSEIEEYKKQPPKDAVRLLIEKYPTSTKLKYGEVEQINAKKVKVQIEVEGQVFSGVGSNKKTARKSASKIAYRELRKKERKATQN